ncbi:MAG: T9SS type A sorting domain-containing protein [Fidelibacterota bacterium]
MRRVWIIVLFGVTLLKAQIDTLEYLSYFPLKTGNRWQYEETFWVSTWDTTFYSTTTVMSDTLMPNGKIYYKLIKSGLSKRSTQYLRVDTTALQVLRYYPAYYEEWNSCIDSELVLYELRPPVVFQDSFSTCEWYDVGLDTGYGPIGLLADSANYLSYSWYDGLENLYHLSEGIGISYIDWWEIASGRSYLVAAEIDGVQYGEFISVQEDEQLPERFSLYQNYPNPFNVTTTIHFDLTEAADVELVIYDILGQKVETLVNGRIVTGNHAVVLDMSDLASGVYFYRLITGDRQLTRKLVVLK